MKTLKLFNGVVAKETNSAAFVSEQGFIIEPNATWAKQAIIDYYTAESLNGNDLNKTFHKSWKKIKNSSRFELYIEQVMHYISTYGSDFEAEVYIPDEIVNLPDVTVSYKVIRAYTKEQMIDKCLGMLKSGIALKEETVDDLLSVLVDELDYVFTGKENIKNKEAIVKMAENYQIFPDNPVDFFRYIFYRTTGSAMLIKNQSAVQAIKSSSFNPSAQFKIYGLDRLSEIFNRFKPLFLAYKDKCPKTINRISKLSKVNHKPLVSNPLNQVTSRILSDSDTHWLDNATPFALFQALSACHARMRGQDAFVYRIRNGKSWVSEGKASGSVAALNMQFILRYMQVHYNLTGQKIYIPEDVKYGLPTSEKMFVGNIPTGTRFYGKKLAVGIYWEDNWGAMDLDLSGMNIGGKVGWNSTYNQDNGWLMYSGDITSAPNGAVEYLYANKGLNSPTVVKNNVFSGSDDCKYKIIIGKGDKVSKDYMMNPDNLFAEVTCNAVQKEMYLGIVIPKKDRQCFVLMNFGAGQARVSRSSGLSDVALKALYQQWKKPYSFNKLAKVLGAELVDSPDNANIDLSLDKLEKDSFTKTFSKK